MGKWKKTLLVALTLALAPVLPAQADVLQNQAVDGGSINQNIVFIDVTNHWANEAIYAMAGRGIVSGYEDASFRPEQTITREEFAKLIAVTFTTSLAAPQAPSFTDVNPDRWSYLYIEAVKSYLTGYYPPNGRAFFDPESPATREDVAVALVKVFGYSAEEAYASQPYFASFKDISEVSPGLRAYIELARSKQLVSGYEDGTFRPADPVTRAEAATLLNRVIKGSAADQAEGPWLNVSLPERTADGTYYISGSTHPEAVVTINGQRVGTTAGKFKEGYLLSEEGMHAVVVQSRLQGGAATVVRREIEYRVDGPLLLVDDTPDAVSSERLTFSGRLTDAADRSPRLYVNDERWEISPHTGEFTRQVRLEEGENTFEFVARNSQGKETSVTRTVIFQEEAPELRVYTFPEATADRSIVVSGKVTDRNDSRPKVYVNDRAADVSVDGEFKMTVRLEPGANTIVFVAENKNGKTATVERHVQLNAQGPRIRLDALPAETTVSAVWIRGTVKDDNDSRPVVTVNDRTVSIGSDGSFSQQVSLSEGDNAIAVRAVNTLGLATTETIRILFLHDGPRLTVGLLPAVSATRSVTLKGTVKDENDSRPSLYINDRPVTVDYDGSFTHYTNLSEGVNQFVLKAVNRSGKTTTETREVEFRVPEPQLRIDTHPATTRLSSMTLRGTVKDGNDSRPTVYVNGQLLSMYGDSFTYELKLGLGANSYTVSASNQFGKTSTVTGVVYRE